MSHIRPLTRLYGEHMVTIENIFAHAYISVVGSLLGILLGSGVGLGILNLSQRMNQDGRRIAPLAPFIPWRTLFVGLLLPNYFPFIPVVHFGPGGVTGTLSVTYVVFLLTIAVFFQSAQHKSDKPIIQLIPWFRTITVFSVILTTHFGMWGGGGLGDYAYLQIIRMEYDKAWATLWVICGIAFLIDECVGFLQWFVYSRLDRVSPQTARVD